MPLSRMLARCATSPIRRWVLDAFPRGQSGVDYDQPAGDAGLFGPDSVTWRIHADFPGMLAGGLSSLMLQALHPRVLAGVYDHSNFRHDLVGRLRRTTAFVAGTTYAATDQARHLIERVRRIHQQVRGTTADGLAYAADDPDLLTWVHVSEAYGKTSEPGSEATPWLSWQGENLQLAFNGPVVFKGEDKEDEEDCNADNPRRYIS